jgi:hypothetical protein
MMDVSWLCGFDCSSASCAVVRRRGEEGFHNPPLQKTVVKGAICHGGSAEVFKVSREMSPGEKPPELTLLWNTDSNRSGCSRYSARSNALPVRLTR